MLSQDISLKPCTSLNNYEDVVVLTGGVNDSIFKHEIDCFVLATKTRESFLMMPIACANHCVAVCGGLLYVMGGSNLTGSVCCFNSKQNEWSTQGTECHRIECSVLSFKDGLYLIGGGNSWHNVQIYNPALNRWRQGVLMETACAGHNAVALEEVIQVKAGHNGEHCQNSAGSYNPSTHQWTEISSISNVQRSAPTSGRKGPGKLSLWEHFLQEPNYQDSLIFNL